LLSHLNRKIICTAANGHRKKNNLSGGVLIVINITIPYSMQFNANDTAANQMINTEITPMLATIE